MTETMISPVAGRVTSEWSKNRRNPATGVLTSHAGIDIAAAIGTPVYAAFSGVLASTRIGSYNGDPHLWNGVKSGNHARIKNTDGAVQYYGHLNTVLVKTGQKVNAGEQIGTVGNTGQVTGPHLHFECWSNDNLNSHFDPRILFERYDLTPGSKPAKTSKPKPNKTPAKTGAATPSASAKAALKVMGLPQTAAGVEAYQKAHGLVADGVWGSKTSAKYAKVKRVQVALNKWKAVNPKLSVDGYVGAGTKHAVKQVKTSNKGGLWKSTDVGTALSKPFLALIGVK